MLIKFFLVLCLSWPILSFGQQKKELADSLYRYAGPLFGGGSIPSIDIVQGILINIIKPTDTLCLVRERISPALHFFFLLTDSAGQRIVRRGTWKYPVPLEIYVQFGEGPTDEERRVKRKGVISFHDWSSGKKIDGSVYIRDTSYINEKINDFLIRQRFLILEGKYSDNLPFRFEKILIGYSELIETKK